jgi:fibronectin type III domain protein
MPNRRWRHAVLVAVVSLFGGAAIAGASTWAVILTNGTHPAEVQSTSVSAPTGGSATGPNDSSLSLDWAPGSGPTPTGYKVTRNGAAVSSGGCKGTLSTTSCVDSGLSASTLYTYSVDALVGTHWTSAQSSDFSGTTIAEFVVTNITSTNASGNTVGIMGIGDTFAVTFNYALNPSTIASTSTMTLVGSSSGTTIKISGLSVGAGFAVSSNYEVSGDTSAATGTLSLSNNNTTVTFTVTGTPSKPTDLVAGAASTFTFAPLATIQDVNADTASTSFSQSSALQIF